MLNQTLKVSGAIIVIAVGAAVFLGPELDQKSPLTSQPLASQPLASTVSVKSSVLSQPQAAATQRQTTSSSIRGIEYLDADANGHFSANVEINGTEIKTLVDTGATMVAFGASDAEKAGIRPAQSEYKYKTQTANGEVSMARVMVSRIRLGSIELENIEAAVLPEGALNGTLLGMSFLRKLQVQTENSRMILKQ